MTDEGRIVRKWLAIGSAIGGGAAAIITTAAGTAIWMTRIQVNQEIHHALPAHPAAADMLNQANLTISLQNQAIVRLQDTVDSIEAQQRLLDQMLTEIKYGGLE